MLKFGTSQERSFIEPSRFNLFSVMWSFDDPLVVLGCLLLIVERSNATPTGFHAVVAPLFTRGGDECASKEFVEFWVAGAAATLYRQGRAILIRNRRLSRVFDPTKGFAGQDILPCLSSCKNLHL